MFNRLVRADSLCRIQTEYLHHQIQERLVVCPDLVCEVEPFLEG